MILSIAICGVVCGILGAKLLYYVTIFDEILANPKKLLDINDGFVAQVSSRCAGRLVKLSRIGLAIFFQYADLVMPSVALAQGFGRIGASAGCCCYGVDRQPFCDRVPRFGLCPEQHSPGSDPAHLKRSGFSALPAASLCGEKVQKTGAGGIPVSDLLQSGRFRLNFSARLEPSGRVSSTSPAISLVSILRRRGDVCSLRKRP